MDTAIPSASCASAIGNSGGGTTLAPDASREPRRADAFASVDEFSSPARALPGKTLAVPKLRRRGAVEPPPPPPPLSRDSVGGNTATTSHHLSGSPLSRSTELQVTKRYDANARGLPIELEWIVPVDSVLTLRPRTLTGPSPQQPDSKLTSNAVAVNGITAAVRLSRAVRAPEDSGTASRPAQQSRSSGPFENHFLACHLVLSSAEDDSAGGGAGPGSSQFAGGSSASTTERSAFDEGNSDAHVQEIERCAWERKVAFLVEISPAPPHLHYCHPMMVGGSASTGGTSPTSSNGIIPDPAVTPRTVRRVVEGTVSPYNRSIGFSNLMPLRELLRSFLEIPSGKDAKSSGSSSAVFRLTMRIFVSHSWSECLSRHQAAASAARDRFQLVGVRNHGSTCYINVLLQSLFHISFFRREVWNLTAQGRRKSEAAVHLQRIFYELETASTAVDALPLLKAIKVNPSVQNDSHEFLSEFFLHRVFKHITDVFSFKAKYVTSCHDVDFASSSEETLFELSLCVGAKYPTLESAVARELSNEPIADLYDTGIEEYGKQRASRQMRIITFPKILFVHSKRFDHYARKVHVSQSYPLTLQLGSGGHSYALHSIIVHHGTGVNSGHFTAYVRISNKERRVTDPATASQFQFFHFDDESVTPVTDEQVLLESVGVHWMSPSSSAYILIYIDVDAFEEATSSFEPPPPEVVAEVKKLMEQERSQSPPPLPRSPLPKPSTVVPPTADAPNDGTVVKTPRQQQLLLQSTNMPRQAGPPASADRGLRKAADSTDMSRVMAACREMIAHPLKIVSRDIAKTVTVTVWTVTGLRGAMSTMRVVHDLPNLQYATKYLRQEQNLARLPSDVPPLYGCDGGAITLRLPMDVSVAELRKMIWAALDQRFISLHYNAHGDQLTSIVTESDMLLFEFLQRKNGTWRPSLPLFDVYNERRNAQDTETPSRGPPHPQSSFSESPNPTNISGTFTIMRTNAKQQWLAASSRWLPPDLLSPHKAVTVGHLVQWVLGEDELSGNVCEAPPEVSLLACIGTPQRLSNDANDVTVSPTSMACTPPNRSAFSRVISADDNDPILSSATAFSRVSSAFASRVSPLHSHVAADRVTTAVTPLAPTVFSPANDPIDDVVVTESDEPSHPHHHQHRRSRDMSVAAASLLVLKSFTGRRLAVLGTLFVARHEPLIVVLETLFLNGYLDWTPLAAQGIPAFRLHELATIPLASWAEPHRMLAQDLARSVQLFEEVRPERLDELSDWYRTPVAELELDHGDILVVASSFLNCGDSADRVFVAADNCASGRAVFSSDDERCSEDERKHETNTVNLSTQLARALIDSTRSAIVCCTMLSPLWASIPIGTTIYLLVDLSDDEAHFHGALEQKLAGFDRAAQRSAETDHPAPKLPNELSPQREPRPSGRDGNSPSGGLSSPASSNDRKLARTLWWCADSASLEKPSLSDRVISTLKPVATKHRVRSLKFVSADDFADAVQQLKTQASVSALQIGAKTAPLDALITLFPTATCALVQWGTLIWSGVTAAVSSAPSAAQPTPERAQIAEDGNSPCPPSTCASPPPTPREQPPAPAADVLYDVNTSLASHNGRAPWLPVETTSPQKEPLTTPASIISAHLQAGLQCTLPRLFVDVASTPSGSSKRRVDLAIAWYGWCRSQPLHRFRLRGVPLNASVHTAFSLAAQFLGCLGGVNVSCTHADVDEQWSDGALTCSHFYHLIHQMAVVRIARGEVVPSSGASSGSGGANLASASQVAGAISAIVPMWSFAMLHDAYQCTIPSRQADHTVEDLLHMLKLRPHRVAGCAPMVELGMLLLPNTPMDVVEALHHKTSDVASRDKDGPAAAAAKRRQAREAFLPASPFRYVDPRRAACIFVVTTMLHASHPAPSSGPVFGEPGLMPAADSADELKLWLDQLYPSRATRDAGGSRRIFVEVHMPASNEGVTAGITDREEIPQCEHWLPRDLLEYGRRASAPPTASPDRGTPGEGSGHAASAVLCNHKKLSTAFLDLTTEDPDEYRALVQRSVKLHYHIMSRTNNGITSSERFDLKKVLILFPARLLVIQE